MVHTRVRLAYKCTKEVCCKLTASFLWLEIWISETYLLTPWSRVLLEKLTGLQLVKNFPAFYGTQRFITAVTNAHYLSPSRASSIQPMPPHPTSWRSVLILSSHLHLGLPNGLFPSGFPCITRFLSPIRATCLVHLIFLDFITRTILDEEYRSLSSSLCSFLYSLITWISENKCKNLSCCLFGASWR